MDPLWESDRVTFGIIFGKFWFVFSDRLWSPFLIYLGIDYGINFGSLFLYLLDLFSGSLLSPFLMSFFETSRDEDMAKTI